MNEDKQVLRVMIFFVVIAILGFGGFLAYDARERARVAAVPQDGPEEERLAKLPMNDAKPAEPADSETDPPPTTDTSSSVKTADQSDGRVLHATDDNFCFITEQSLLSAFSAVGESDVGGMVTQMHNKTDLKSGDALRLLEIDRKASREMTIDRVQVISGLARGTECWLIEESGFK